MLGRDVDKKNMPSYVTQVVLVINFIDPRSSGNPLKYIKGPKCNHRYLVQYLGQQNRDVPVINSGNIKNDTTE